MLLRAIGYKNKFSADLSVQALRRAFGTLVQYEKKLLPDLSVQDAAALRRCSHMLHQARQLHGQQIPPDGFPQEHDPLLLNNNRGAPSACTFKPNGTVHRSFDQRIATLRSMKECVSVYELYELRLLLRKKTVPICYVWCDPSPLMRITQGISMTINVNKLVKAGCKVKILMADWFARMDPRICGNVCKVQTICRYNIEMFRASGMDLAGVEFVQLSDEISRHADEYWPVAMDIARNSNLSEIKRCFSIHTSEDTRSHGSTDPYTMREFTPADTLYPCLQSAVILFPEVDIWMLGMDQRGANMLAREYCQLMQWKNKPIALFHDMAPDLFQDPECEEWGNLRWPIFMEDDEEDVIRKIENAFCPPKFAEDNPCLEYIKHVILPWFRKFEVVRKEDNGCSKIFLSMKEIIADYRSGALRPADVKQALVKATNLILQPVHKHFRSSAEAKKLADAMEPVHKHFRSSAEAKKLADAMEEIASSRTICSTKCP